MTTLRNLYYVYRTERADTPPLHTDPALQSQRWNKLYRSARRGFVWDAALLMLVAVLTALLLADTPILNLLTTSAVPLILFGLYQLCSLPAAWAEVQDLSRLPASRVRRLEAGEPMDHRAPYPRRQFVPLLSFALCTLLIVLLILPRYILPLLGGDMRPVNQVSDFSPLSLAQVEGKATALMKRKIPTNRTTSITAEGTAICCAGTSGRYFRPDRRTWPES